MMMFASHMRQVGFQYLNFWRRSGPSSPCGSSGVSLGQRLTNGSATRSLTRFFLSSPTNWNLWSSARHTPTPRPEPRDRVHQDTGRDRGRLFNHKVGKKPQIETDDGLQDFIFTAEATAVDYFFSFLRKSNIFFNLKCLFTMLKD